MPKYSATPVTRCTMDIVIVSVGRQISRWERADARSGGFWKSAIAFSFG